MLQNCVYYGICLSNNSSPAEGIFIKIYIEEF
jgi:hypothetical protein